MNQTKSYRQRQSHTGLNFWINYLFKVMATTTLKGGVCIVNHASGDATGRELPLPPVFEVLNYAR